MPKENKWDDPEYRRAYHRKWSAKKRKRMTSAEKEKRRASKRATYRKYRRRILNQQRKDYKVNPGKYSKRAAQYYKKNKDRIIKRVRKYEEDNKEKVQIKRKAYNMRTKEKIRDYSLKRAYGISLDIYNELLKNQNGQCANKNCTHTGEEDKRGVLFVDHCHSKNRVRGLLCNRCNRTLGMLKESPSLIRGLADYIERTRA